MITYNISVPSSSIKLAKLVGINVAFTSTGISFPDGSLVNSTLGTTSPQIDYAFNQANSALTLAQDVYNFANTIGGGSAIDNVARQRIVSTNAYISVVNTQQTSNLANLNSALLSNVEILNASITSNVILLTNLINVSPIFTGTSGTAIPSNRTITFSSTNGITTVGSESTLTINTPQDLRTSASPTFNNLTLTNALPINQGGTGATSAGAALTALLPSGTTSGYVLTTGGPGSYYWAAGGGGGGGATPGTTINSTRLTYTANGSGLSYTVPSYTPGASQLRVYFDGLRQFPSEYTETSNTICTFSTPPASGVVVMFEVDGYIVNPYYANNIAYSINSTISPTANTIQQAIDGLASIVALKLGTSFTGIATGVTTPVGTSNTAFATTAFVNNMANSGITFAHNISGSASSASSATTATTATTANALNTGNNYQINSLGVNTAASGTAGEIRATNEITAYYSDDRLKTKLGKIENALDKLCSLEGFYYEANETAQALGYQVKREVGISAQDTQKVLPEIVKPAPIDEKYLTVNYEKFAPLFVEAIKELRAEINDIKDKLKCQ